ncbi:hypothetical protein G6011_04832 [Alternaria panax]|uniref:Uncharacterized protein n=1 Tax=Alternaria panax TaxID=48097 RepID=A0AAD4NU96_9PLEO|nr:hypothetical protein G6011_04832 [Alternaria panax]
MNHLQQLVATAEAHSSSDSIPNSTANRADTFNTVPGNYTEKELEAAATMLTLNKPVVYSKEDAEAAYILSVMNKADSFPEIDGERTITDSERTVTAEPTPVPSPTRLVTPRTRTPAPTQPSEDTSAVPNTATASISLPPAKKMSPEEYAAIRKAR